MDQTDDGYGVCSHCTWNGKLRRDGTVRRHRDQRRSADGSQRCTGEGERPVEFATTPYDSPINASTRGNNR